MEWEETLRSFDFLGGQNAPRASDGVGIRLLYRCEICGRIWLQDGKRIALDVGQAQAQALARELSADLARLPSATCRLCLYREGGGAVEVDEYGTGAGFGFSWESPHPQPVHAILTILSQRWLAHLADPAASLPDVVTRPERMRAVLAWFAELLPPRQFRLLDQKMLQVFNATNLPGFGQPGTQHWRWKGGRCEIVCPPLGGKALLLLAVAMPAAEPFSLDVWFPVCQLLAFLTLLGGVAGEKRPDPPPDGSPLAGTL